MASSTKGGRNQGAAWGALLKAHAAEKQRTEKNPSPLIPNEIAASSFNKFSGASPQPSFSPSPNPTIQTDSGTYPNSMYRLSNLRAALQEEDTDWVRNGDDEREEPIPILLPPDDTLTGRFPPDDPNQQNFPAEQTQLAIVSSDSSLTSSKTGTSSSTSASPPLDSAESAEPVEKYTDWGAWQREKLGTLNTIKQNTDSSPSDRSSLAYQLLAEKPSVARPTSVNQSGPTKSASVNVSDQQGDFTNPFSFTPPEPSQPEREKKVKQRKKKDKEKEEAAAAAPSPTTPIDLLVQTPRTPPLETATNEFRAFNLPPPFLSTTSHDSNSSRSPSPRPKPSTCSASQTAVSPTSMSTTSAKSDIVKPKSAPSASSALTSTTYNIAPVREKPPVRASPPVPKADKQKSSGAGSSGSGNSKHSKAPRASAGEPPPSSSSSGPPAGTFANDPAPLMDEATFPELSGAREPLGPGQSWKWQPQPAEYQYPQRAAASSGLAALNAMQELEAENLVRTFEDWCLKSLAGLRISCDVEVAADELHTLESEEQVFLRVCLLVGPTKSALADEFSSSYLRKRMHFDLQRLRRRAEQRKRARASKSAGVFASPARSALRPHPAANAPLFNFNAADFVPAGSSAAAAVVPDLGLANFPPPLSAQEEREIDQFGLGLGLDFDASEMAASVASSANAKAPKLKVKGGGKKGVRVDPSLLGFQ